MAFDKSKPYGIIGGIYGIARFEQDGKYYDAQFNELDKDGNPKKSAKAEKEPKADKEAKAEKEPDALSADDQLAKNLG